MTKVVKFGGTSLAEAAQFLKVADIVRSDPDRRYVVPSAPAVASPRTELCFALTASQKILPTSSPTCAADFKTITLIYIPLHS